MARAGEVSNPDGMLAVNQVTETARLADQAPLQLTTCHIAQPPVAVPAVVEHSLRTARRCSDSNRDGMLAVNQVTETARLADQAPLQWQHLRGERASLLRVRPFCLDEKAPEARRLAVADVTYFLAGARIPPSVQFRVGDCLSEFVTGNHRQRIEERAAEHTTTTVYKGNQRVINVADVVVIAAKCHARRGTA